MSFNFFKILKKGAKTKFWPKVLAKFSDIWKFTHYIIYTIKFHRVLKNGAKKTILSFERGDHVESIYIIRDEFWYFQNTKKGRLTKNLAEKELKWPLSDVCAKSWPLITKITIASDSLTPKTYKHKVELPLIISSSQS